MQSDDKSPNNVSLTDVLTLRAVSYTVTSHWNINKGRQEATWHYVIGH